MEAIDEVNVASMSLKMNRSCCRCLCAFRKMACISASEPAKTGGVPANGPVRVLGGAGTGKTVVECTVRGGYLSVWQINPVRRYFHDLYA